MQSEADHIDEYICPNCTSNSNVNIANMKNLTVKDYETLKKLIKQIQVINFLFTMLLNFKFLKETPGLNFFSVSYCVSVDSSWAGGGGGVKIEIFPMNPSMRSPPRQRFGYQSALLFKHIL